MRYGGVIRNSDRAHKNLHVDLRSYDVGLQVQVKLGGLVQKYPRVHIFYQKSSIKVMDITKLLIRVLNIIVESVNMADTSIEITQQTETNAILPLQPLKEVIFRTPVILGNTGL